MRLKLAAVGWAARIVVDALLIGLIVIGIGAFALWTLYGLWMVIPELWAAFSWEAVEIFVREHWPTFAIVALVLLGYIAVRISDISD